MRYLPVMRAVIRKILILLVATSLAAANGFVPKHAHASIGNGHNVAAVEHSHDAHDHHHSATPHSHDSAQTGSQGAAPSDQLGLSIANCCVASCNAIALIFATIDLPDALPMGILEARTPDFLVLAARTSDDPPPR